MAGEHLYQPVTQERVSSRIANRLQEAIRQGELKPGDRLPAERELAQRFQVSRISIRDSLRILEVLGLVEVRVGAGGGTFISSPTSEVVGQGFSNLLLLSELRPEHVTEARILFELGTVSAAVARAEQADIKMLERVCDDAVDSLERGEFDTDLSRDFHLVLARATHNPAIALMTETFRGPLSMAVVRQSEPRPTAYASTIKDHRRIIAAIVDRDVAAGKAAMVRHLRRGVPLDDGANELLFGSFAGDERTAPDSDAVGQDPGQAS